LSLSNFHVKLTAKGLFRNLQLLSGCRKNTVVFHAGLDTSQSSIPLHHPAINMFHSVLYAVEHVFCCSVFLSELHRPTSLLLPAIALT
ncbi:hypothetical protein NQZ68_037028, partial [Dissostichus eleginoides]